MTAALAPKHHPACRHLCSYAEARADESLNLFIGAHLSLCPSCRHKLQDYENKAAINLEDMPPEHMDTTCLENLLAKIDEHGPPACIDVTIPIQPVPQASYIPDVLQEYVGVRLDEFLWKRQEGFETFVYRQTRVALSLPSRLQIIRAPKDAALKISGGAMVLVLQGEIKTLFGTYKAGDVLNANILSTIGAKAAEETLCLVRA
jgi:putative transcriptional regulator